MLEPFLAAILGGLVGGLFAFPLARYQLELQRSGRTRRLALQLAHIGVLLRREVVRQFIDTSEGEWLPQAMERQTRLLDRLDSLFEPAEHIAGSTSTDLLAASEALAANIAELNRWRTHAKEVGLADAVGETSTSHMDVVVAAQLVEEALSHLPHRRIRQAALELSEAVRDARLTRREQSREFVNKLQDLTPEELATWVRDGTPKALPWHGRSA